MPNPEKVYVIPPYPHRWWKREEVEEGVLVMLGWPDGDGRIWRVTAIDADSVCMKQERGYMLMEENSDVRLRNQNSPNEAG